MQSRSPNRDGSNEIEDHQSGRQITLHGQVEVAVTVSEGEDRTVEEAVGSSEYPNNSRDILFPREAVS